MGAELWPSWPNFLIKDKYVVTIAIDPTVSLGPVALNLMPVLLALAVWLGVKGGQALAPSEVRPAVDHTLWRALIVGVIVARLGYVWMWRQAYLEQPWSILDIRDGGWAPAAGLAAACLYGMAKARAWPELAKALVRGYAVALVAVALGLAAFWGPSSKEVRLPDLEVQDLNGQPQSLAALAGRPVVINLWATWCPPCRREMPVLQAAQQAHPDVHIVLLNQGESAAAVQAYLRGQSLALRQVWLDPAQRAGATFDQVGLPTTLFFDAQGRLVSRRVGELSAAVLRDRLQAIGVPASP